MKLARTPLTVLLTAALAAPALADEPTPQPDEGPPVEVVPEEAPAPLPPPKVGFEKGFFITSPDGRFGIKLGGRAQFRFTYVNDAGEHGANFSLPRVRFKFSGHAFDEILKYKFQIDFGKGGVNLKDAYVDVRADEMAIVRLGQFKVPNSRQGLASSTKQQLVDRSITNGAFGLDRDVGIMLMSDYKTAPIEYAVGIWNGTGDSGSLSGDVTVAPLTGAGTIDSGKFSNVPDLPNPLFNARVGVHTPGHDGYAESDHETSEPGVGVGGGVWINFDADDDDDASMGGNVDWSVKAKGFAHNGAVYVRADQDGEEFTDLALSNIGVHASVGYTIKGMVQPVFRFARLLPPGADNDTTELLGGVTVYFFGDNVKWATDAGAVITETTDGDETAVQVRTQFQLDF